MYYTKHGNRLRTSLPKRRVVQFSRGSPHQRKLVFNAGCKPPSQSTPYCDSKTRWYWCVDSTKYGGKPDSLASDGGSNSVENRLSNIQQILEPNELGLAWITKQAVPQSARRIQSYYDVKAQFIFLLYLLTLR